ncbi:MAG: proline--tRNA ligase [Candidatus Aenigmatarchaeota archaeon]
MSEELGITFKKKDNFSEWYTEIVQKSELADMRYNIKGFLVHRPWSVKIMKLMNSFIEEELEKNGHEPVWFPAVIPESFLKKEKEHAKFSAEVFWITEGGRNYDKLEEKLALRPTSETAMYTMFSIWVRSWRDLPLKTYQNCQVWRYESYTRPFLRGREFFWIEAHDVFATKEEAEKQVVEDMRTTKKTLHEKFAIPFIFFKRPQHDKFKGAVDTFAADTLMPDGKTIQLPSTHLLGQNFSKPFNIEFLDKDEKKKHGWQTCYGPAAWRILGALAAIHGDDKGLVLPPAIAPQQAVIVPIYYEDKEKENVYKKCQDVLKELEKSFRITFDQRDEYTPGWKFNYWELKGVPIRIEIGPRDIEKEQVVLVRRDTGKKLMVKQKEMKKEIDKLLDSVQKYLTEKADKLFKENIREAKDMKELKDILENKGGLVKVSWCGNVECADAAKAETSGGTIRGTVFGKEEQAKGNCALCGKKANQVVYMAKSY